MEEDLNELAVKTIDRLKCCIAGTCMRCSYCKYMDDCGDRLNQDCLILIRAAYKEKED